MLLPDIIILAGGLGTRLREEVNNLPKAMAPVNNKPFLEYLLEYIKTSGFQRVILSTGYVGNTIEEYFGNTYKSLNLEYSFESEPLGTGGAIKHAFKKVTTPFFIVLNGDTMFRINLQQLFQKNVELLADVSVALREVKDASRYGQVTLDSDNRITEFKEKSSVTNSGLINGGIYTIKSKFFKNLVLPDKFSFEKDWLQQEVKKQEITGFVFNDYFIDIGVPDDYKRAQIEFNDFKY